MTFHLARSVVRRLRSRSPMVVMMFVVFIMLGCGKGEEEKRLESYLTEHYEGEFEIVDKTKRGAKNWFVVRHDGRLFKMAASGVPPHHVVEDRFPDLQFSRMLEARTATDLNPVVDAELSKVDRELYRETASFDGVIPADVNVYLSMVGAADESGERRVKLAVGKLATHVPIELRWEARFYESSADPTDLQYRSVVPVKWMEQSAERSPQPEKVVSRIAGVAEGENVTVTLR